MFTLPNGHDRLTWLMKTRSAKALIIVDMQNDFVPGGALGVPDGASVIPVINRLQQLFELVVATQDWHPMEHGSFARNHPGKNAGETIDLNGLPQMLWPVHCVQNTSGAAFVPGLKTERVAQVFQKGTDPEVDSYSGFFDNGRRKSTGLENYLRARTIGEVFVVGLATNICVKYTAMMPSSWVSCPTSSQMPAAAWISCQETLKKRLRR